MLFKNDYMLPIEVMEKCFDSLNIPEIPASQYRPNNQIYLHPSSHNKESHINHKSDISYPTETVRANIEKNKTEKILRFDYNYHIDKILQALGIDYNH